MIKVLEKLYNEKIILDHGMEVGKELANVLSGGETSLDKELSEDDLYKLELDAFMKLIESQKTQERSRSFIRRGHPNDDARDEFIYFKISRRFSCRS